MRDVRKNIGTSCPSSSTVTANFEAMPHCQNNMARPQAQTARMPGRRRRLDATVIVKGRPARRVTSSEAQRISRIYGIGAQRNLMTSDETGVIRQETKRVPFLNAIVNPKQNTANRRIHLIPTLWHVGCEAAFGASCPG
jgi:hypothetical protein